MAGSGRPWTNHQVWQILTNPKYCGRPVFNRHHSPLGTRRTYKTAPDEWLPIPGGAPAIVSHARWQTAQAEFERRKGARREELLDHLRVLWQRHGYFRASMLRGKWGFGVDQYRAVFGSTLIAALEAGIYLDSQQLSRLRGYATMKPAVQAQALAAQKASIVRNLEKLLRNNGRLTTQLIDGDPSLPHTNTIKRIFGDLNTAYRLAGYLPNKSQSVRMFGQGCRLPDWSTETSGPACTAHRIAQ
ncbi:MAG: recombinase family protein [Pseudomonadota bacterium]